MKILIIDDDEQFLNLLKDLISNYGYTVYAATKGIKALEIMTENEIDLVIFDVIMEDTPIMSFICTMKSSYPKTPLVLISGLPYNHLIVNSMILGADEFIPKPINTSSLVETINKYDKAA